jgi:hypothetical protein
MPSSDCRDDFAKIFVPDEGLMVFIYLDQEAFDHSPEISERTEAATFEPTPGFGSSLRGLEISSGISSYVVSRSRISASTSAASVVAGAAPPSRTLPSCLLDNRRWFELTLLGRRSPQVDANHRKPIGSVAMDVRRSSLPPRRSEGSTSA